MRRLARVFSRLALLALIGAACLLWLRPPLPAPPLAPLSGPVDLVLVEKSARRLSLLRGGEVLRSYRVALGFAPKGAKTREGDGRTPEGRFTIDRRNAASAYTLSLGIDYPRPQDKTRARAAGHSPGGDIMIHGQPNALPDAVTLPGDWTAGCMALSNAEMREIWAVVALGTPVEIRP
jgi:murein L,D-transpeptidase YafK